MNAFMSPICGLFFIRGTERYTYTYKVTKCRIRYIIIIIMEWANFTHISHISVCFCVSVYVCIEWFSLKYMSLVFAFCHRFPCTKTHILSRLHYTFKISSNTCFMVAHTRALLDMSHLCHHHFVVGYKMLPELAYMDVHCISNDCLANILLMRHVLISWIFPKHLYIC